MKYLQLRKSISRGWLIAVAVYGLFLLIAAVSGVAIMPSKYGNGIVATITQDPDTYWFGIRCYAVLTAFSAIWAIFESPWLAERVRRQKDEIEQKLKKPTPWYKPDAQVRHFLVIYALFMALIFAVVALIS